MKHKIIITESQYGALLSKLNEQSSMQFGGKKLRFGKSKFEKMSLIKVVVNIL